MLNPNQTSNENSIKDLSLTGVCRYSINNDDIFIEIERISNNRPTDNLSGSLSLEIWALPAPYQGGDFHGHQIVAQPLGILKGQHKLIQSSWTLPLHPPAEGTWYFTMMLREWDQGKWTTRDYMNFTQPVMASYKIVLH
jgi:hypothetical protein